MKIDSGANGCVGNAISQARLSDFPFFASGVGDDGCKFIKDLLLCNKSIHTLDLNLNQITDRGCRFVSVSSKALAKQRVELVSFKLNPSLDYIDIFIVELSA